MNTKQYHIRLIARFTYYDPDRGAHIYREWAAGEIIADSDTIKLLEARGAPIERIDAVSPASGT